MESPATTDWFGSCLWTFSVPVVDISSGHGSKIKLQRIRTLMIVEWILYND